MNHVRALKDAMIDTHPGITLSQLEFLFLIQDCGFLTHKEAADLMGLTPGGISRMVDVFGSGKKKGRALALGLVKVEKDSDDDRIKHISMTIKGDLFCARYFQTLRAES